MKKLFILAVFTLLLAGMGSGSTFGDTIVPHPDDNSFTESDGRGVKVSITGSGVLGFHGNFSSNTAGITKVYLKDASNGTLLATTSVSGVTSGGGDGDNFNISIEQPLQQRDYYIYADAEGSSYTNGKDDDPAYPYTASKFEMIDGTYNSGSNEAFQRMNIHSLTSIIEANPSPTINSNATEPASPDFGDLVNITANVTDPDGDAFTVTADVVNDTATILSGANLTDHNGDSVFNLTDAFTFHPETRWINITITAEDNNTNTATSNINLRSDYDNTVRANDSVTGAFIDDLSIQFSNGTTTFSRSTTGTTLDMWTSELPTGSNTVTLSASGYDTLDPADTITVNSTTQFNNVYEMDVATFTLEVFDEQTENDLPNPTIITISNSTDEETYGVLNKLKDSSDTDSPGSAFDRNLNTKAIVDPDDDGGGGPLEGYVAFTRSSDNNLFIRGDDNGDGNSGTLEVWDGNAETWVTVQSDPIGIASTQTVSFTVNNSDGRYDNGRVRLSGMNGDVDVFEIWANNLGSLDKDIETLPQGEVTITVNDIQEINGYLQRTYLSTFTDTSTVNLDTYLLQRGQGVSMSVEVFDTSGDRLSGATVSIQKKFGTTYRTVAQQETGASGGAAFNLDDEEQYQIVVTKTGYSTFTGLFNPTTYQFDPLEIQLATANLFGFETPWDFLSVQILPDTKQVAANITGFNTTITDSQSNLDSFGLIISNSTHTFNTSTNTGSTSGGTITLTADLRNQTLGETINVTLFFTRNGQYFQYTKLYRIGATITKGDHSILAFMQEFRNQAGSLVTGFLALFLTFMASAKLGGLLGRMGSGLVGLVILGFFSLPSVAWIDPFYWLLALLAVLGIYGLRR